jgi:EAL domain-containing protein (putative c-di-GMP-specific phosphodiesterase class I)
LEVTESVLMANPESAAGSLMQLRDMGIKLSLDDFGTGYSSLSYLHSFPFNSLKIDRSFVSQMDVADKNEEIVRTILNLAHNLNMDVIAEGVETETQLEHLRALRCHYGQGYFFSGALDGASARELIMAKPQW